MPTPLEGRPIGLQRMIAAKRSEYERLPAVERAEVDESQRSARERAAERRNRAMERTRTICSMSFAGAKAYEIAEATGLTVHGVDAACRRLGIPFSTRVSGRRRFAWMTDETIEQLEEASRDRGSTLEETVEDVWTLLCADDGLILRRILHVKRRGAP